MGSLGNLTLIQYFLHDVRLIPDNLFAWEYSWHFAMQPLVSLQNEVRETCAEIPYWRRITSQICTVLNPLFHWSPLIFTSIVFGDRGIVMWQSLLFSQLLSKTIFQIGAGSPNLDIASDWLCLMGNLLQPIRSSTHIWVVMHHQYKNSRLISQTSFRGETINGLTKWYVCFFS